MKDEHSEVVAACTEGALYKYHVICCLIMNLDVALQDDPDYIKALQRRAASNEVLDTWASLTSAQEGLPVQYRCE